MTFNRRRHLEVMTQSSLRTFRSCHEKYRITYVEGKRPVKQSQPLVYGNAWHDVRETLWNGTIGDAYNAADRVAKDFDDIDRMKLFAMMYGYEARWRSWLDSIEIVAVEQRFDCIIDSEFSPIVVPMAGKFDAIIREKGELWVVEEKTAASTGDLYWRRLAIDPQCSTYFEAALQMYGEYPAGIIYMVNQKTKLSPLTRTEELRFKKCKGTKECKGSLTVTDAEEMPVCFQCKSRLEPYANQRINDETPGEFYERLLADISEDPAKYYQKREVPRLDSQILRAKEDMKATHEDIVRSSLKNRWGRNPDACIANYGVCPYFDVCTGSASLDDQTLFRTAKAPHEELEGGKTFISGQAKDGCEAAPVTWSKEE